MEKTISTTIRIPEDLKKQLEVIAEKDNRSFNNLVNIILKSYAKENAPDSTK